MIISENEESGDSEVEEVGTGNPAMADAMRRVLSIGKNTSKSSIVLAKAKVLTKKETPKPKDPGFEIEKNADGEFEDSKPVKEEEDVKDVKPDKLLLKRKRIKKQEVAALGRIKPSPLDREKERPLVKIATRGVVQLFNAVREQQKVISKKIEEAGPSETKKEKVLKSIDKRAFLDVLRGFTEPDAADSKTSLLPDIKSEDECGDGEQPNWSVLRDDFMLGAKLKDWDKKGEEDLPESDSAKKLKL